MCAPPDVDARTLNSFDRVAYSIAVKFDAIELSPVNPLGTNFVLGGIDTNNVVATIRNVEVLGDSTSALALECARRRRIRAGDVRLCGSQRVIRLQPFDVPGFTPHFRLFAMDSVDRNKVRETVRAHRPGSGERLQAELGVVLPSPVTDPRTELRDIPEPQFSRLCAMKDRVVDPLMTEFPEAQFRFTLARLEGVGYYTGLCLRISPESEDGAGFAVADGGFTDWSARLLQDKKERLITSGIGTEFVCRRYRAGSKPI